MGKRFLLLILTPPQKQETVLYQKLIKKINKFICNLGVFD